MSTKTIPAQTIKTCDCCNSVLSYSTNHRQSGALHLKRDLLDMQGAPCASGAVSLDLCDDCLPIITEAVNTAAQSIAKKA